MNAPLIKPVSEMRDGRRAKARSGNAVGGRAASRGLPNPVDVWVGGRMRDRRIQIGMSQIALGERLRISFQQVQKYERGTNRISASRIVDLARALDVAPAWLFEGMPAEIAGQSPAVLGDPRNADPALLHNGDTSNSGLRLVRFYRALNTKDRAIVMDMARALARGAGAEVEES